MNQAIAALGALPETSERMSREFYLQYALYSVLAVTRGRGADETVRASIRVRELSEKTGNPEQLIITLNTAWDYAVTQGEWTAAQQIAEQMMEVAQRGGSRYGLTLAHFFEGIFFHFCGELTQAMRHFEATLALYNETDWSRGIFGDPQVLARAQMGMLLWHFGNADQGRAKIREAISLSEHWKNPRHMAMALVFASGLCMDLRDPGGVGEAAERLFTLASEQLPEFAAWASVYRGWAMAALGRTDEGLALIHAVLDSAATLRVNFLAVLNWRALSEAQARAGQLEEALATIEQAFSAVGEQKTFLPGLLGLRGELHLRRGDETEAAGDFLEAITVARRVGSKAFELRATTSLARLLAKQGNRDEARAMLAEIYGQFTEGFDTADLKDAKALLDELK